MIKNFIKKISILKRKILDLKNKKQNDNEAYYLKNELNKHFKEKKELQRKIIELEKGKNKDKNYSFIFYVLAILIFGFFYFYKNEESKKSKRIITNNDFKSFQNKIEKLKLVNRELKNQNKSYLTKINKSNSEKLRTKKTEYKIINNEKKVNENKNYFTYKGKYLYKRKTFTFAPIYNDSNLQNKLYGVESGDYVYVIKKEKKGVYKIWYLGAFGFISEGMLKNK